MIIYEPFDYPDGEAITGQVNPFSSQTWNSAGTAGTNGVHSVTTPGLSSPAGFPAASGNKADMTTADQGEFNRIIFPGGQTFDINTSLYYSVLINVPSLDGLTIPHTNLNANNDMIIAFNNGLGTARPANWAGELVIRLGSAPNTYNLGIRASSTTGGTTYFSGDLSPGGDTHLVVARYVQGAANNSGTDDSNDIWLDPSAATFGVNEGSVPSADGSSNGAINSGSPPNNYAAALIIGAGISAGSNPDHIYLDEIRVGTTWADVTTPTVVVPEPASIGLLGIAALGLLSRRRRIL